MFILGIETSCDETAAAILDTERGLLSNVISSQLEHQRYGGVVPELASRAHVKLILPVIKRALTEAGIALGQLDGVAVTAGPGLVGSLLVGVSVAKAVSFALKIPIIGIHHIEGHIFANFLEEGDLTPPFVALIVSGGHTQLLSVPQLGEYESLGATRDDAAGEAFDKVAKMLGLGYPGGPVIDRLARGGNPDYVRFPRAYMEDGDDFSFSGLKTAVLTFSEKLSKAEIKIHSADIAASFQAAVVDVLVDKSIGVALKIGSERIVIAGGVASNSRLRSQLKKEACRFGISVFCPPPIFCTDNGAMIAKAGAFRLSRGESSDLTLNPQPRMKLP